MLLARDFAEMDADDPAPLSGADRTTRSYDNRSRQALITARRARIAALLREGTPTDKLPAAVGVSAKTVRRDLAALRAAGDPALVANPRIAARQGAARSARRARVAELYRASVTAEEIARRERVTLTTIQRDLRALGAAGLVSLPSGRPDTPPARARTRAGLTIGELADRTGLSRKTVSAAERTARPHRDSAIRLATALGADPAELWPQLAAVLHDRVSSPPVPDPNDEVARRRGEVARLRDEDFTPAQIAARLEVSRATVYRDIDTLRKNGWRIPVRPYGRPPGSLSDETPAPTER